MDKVYVDEIALIRKEHAEVVNMLTSKQTSLARFKTVLEATANELDRLKDNNTINPEEKMRMLTERIAKMQKSQKKMEEQMGPLQAKMKELTIRATDVLAAIKSKYPDYTDEEIKKILEERLS